MCEVELQGVCVWIRVHALVHGSALRVLGFELCNRMKQTMTILQSLEVGS